MQHRSLTDHRAQAGPPEGHPPGAARPERAGIVMAPVVLAAAIAAVASLGMWALVALYDRDPHLALVVVGTFTAWLTLGVFVGIGAIGVRVERMLRLLHTMHRRVEDHQNGGPTA